MHELVALELLGKVALEPLEQVSIELVFLKMVPCSPRRNRFPQSRFLWSRFHWS